MSEHMWVNESLPLFAAGGLNADERGRVQRHLGQCHECSRALDELHHFTREMSELFMEVRPVPDLGEAMAASLRRTQTTAAPPRRFRRPSARVFRMLAVCASVVIVMVLGGVLSETILNPRRDASARDASARDASVPGGHRRGAGVFLSDGRDVHGSAHHGTNLESGEKTALDPLRFDDATGRPSNEGRLGEMALNKSFLFHVTPADQELDVGKETLEQRKELLDTSRLTRRQDKGGQGLVSLDKLGAEFAQKMPSAHKSQEEAEEGKVKAKVPLTPTMPTMPTNAPSPSISPAYGYFPAGSIPGPSSGMGGGFGMGGIGMPPSPPPGLPVAPAPVTTPASPPLDTRDAHGKATVGDEKISRGKGPQYIPFPEVPKAESARSENEADKKSKGNDVGELAGKQGQKPSEDPAKSDDNAAQQGASKAGESKGPDVKSGDASSTTSPANAVQRRIIRTGTIEFEVDSFDIGVATLTKLVLETKGAFINTVNSEKRPNGKVAGAVVVRMPPEQLDEFVLKLRRELGKFGELKVQQISSQDITKQYTDLESQLKAARTMEERLITIIKEGKGVIKDLLQAEKELGVWRTKIEEIEGTLRYYANQAALSTLTIALVEKELRQAVSILETERVQVGIEVEDVEAAHRTAIEAVNEMKGRIVKTELKKHAGGQFNAVLDFEIAPEQSGAMRDRLKQIGALSRLDIDRVQRSEGGTPARDTKVKRGDSQFFVNLYNLANIAARETIQIRVAATDVPKAYQAIRTQIDKAKARIRDAQVSEQDRENVSAKIDVDVNRPDDIAVLKAMTDAGEVLHRQLHRRSDDANVTDAKVLINLQIVNAFNIPARETVTLRVAVPDVTKSFNELREKAQKAKARLVNAQMQEADRLNVTGQFELDVPRPDDAALLELFTGAGEVLSRQVQRRSDVANVIDTKVAFHVTLVSSTNIQAREVVILRVAVPDVLKAFQQAREDIGKAKARVVSDVQEKDRQNDSALIGVDIARPEHIELLKKFGELGEIINRLVHRHPDNPNLTDTKVQIYLELWNVAKVQARDALLLRIAVIDVPKVYHVLRDDILKAKAAIQVGKVHEADRTKVHADLAFDVQRPENDRILKLLLDAGDVMSKDAERKGDNELALDSKVHFKVRLVDALTLPARKRVVMKVAAADVDKSYHQILDELAKAKSFVDYDNSRKETGREDNKALLAFAVRRPEDGRILSVLGDLGEVLLSKDEPNASGENSTDANVAFSVEIVSAANIQPRETVTLRLEVDNVSDKLDQIAAAVKNAKGRIYNPTIRREDTRTEADVTYDLPLGALRDILAKVQAAGRTVEQKATQDPKAPDGKLALARIHVKMSTRDPLVGEQEGFKSGITSGLSTSIRGLALSLQFLIVGLLFVVPWLLLLYAGYWVVRRYVLGHRTTPTPPTASATTE